MKNTAALFFLVFMTIITIGLGYIVFPFIISILLAIIVAYLFYPIRVYFIKKGASALVATLFAFISALVFLIGPIVGITILVSIEARDFYRLVLNYFSSEERTLYQLIEQTKVYQLLAQYNLIPQWETFFTDTQLREQLVSIGNRILSTFINSLRAFLINLPTFLINVFLWVYLTYFLLLDGEKFYSKLKALVPLPAEEQNEMLSGVLKVVDATLIGTFLIGIAEGILCGIIFFILGIPGAITWGVAMGILSMIPVVGANGILIPVALYFLLTNNISSALVILIAGSGSVAIIEYIIKPKIVGDKSNMHPSIITIAILGGIYRMGLLGLLVGPATATLSIAFLEILRRKLALIKSPPQQPDTAPTTPAKVAAKTPLPNKRLSGKR